MYTDEEINNLFIKYIVDKSYFERYVDIYKYFKMNDTKSNKFNFHHFFPVNYGKEMLNEKNRYHAIEKHDELYDINDNIVKLPVKWHLISHYCLAMSTLRNDDINSFFTLIKDYSKNIQDYTFNDVMTLAQQIEEIALPNQIDHYLTLNERKELYKQTAKENKEKYAEEHKDELLIQKEKQKKMQKEYREKWKEEHKEEIEERKRKQKEFVKNLKLKRKEEEYKI